MHDHRTRHQHPPAKSLARLAAEAAFSTPGSLPDADVPGTAPPATTRAVAGTLHVIDAGAAACASAATAAAAAAASSAARAPRVFRLRERSVSPQGDDAGTAAPEAAAAAATAASPGRTSDAATADATTAASPARRRRRRAVAPPVTVIYRAPEQARSEDAAEADAAADGDEAAARPGSPRDLAELQAGIEADMALARRAAAFDFSGTELADEWAQLQREIERLSSELAQAQPVVVASIV